MSPGRPPAACAALVRPGGLRLREELPDGAALLISRVRDLPPLLGTA
jgi:hypothetical protein